MKTWNVWLDPEGNDRCAYIDCDGKAVAHVFADDVVDRDRNAALIAAAPCVLDALMEIFAESEKSMAIVDMPMLSYEWHEKTRAVIATALGPNAEIKGQAGILACPA